MRAINYNQVNIKTYLTKFFSDEQQYKQLQDNWNILRTDIINNCISKGFSKQTIKKILPPYITRIIIGNFSRLNKIFLFKDNIDDYQKELAKYIFNYGFSTYNNTLVKLKQTNNIQLAKIQKLSAKSSDIADFFIDNSTEMNISTCFYCETNYINAYPVKGGKKRQFELDHFFGKEDCPLLAISLFNLVPSCKVCNGKSIKGSKNLYDLYNIDKKNKKYDFSFLSPASSKYLFNNLVKIRVIPTNKNNWTKNVDYIKKSKEYEIKFITDNETYKKEIVAFFLEERYNYKYTKNEALTLLNLKEKYSDSYISLLSNALAKEHIYLSPEVIKESIFHEEAEKQNQRIFLKMKKDILENN